MSDASRPGRRPTNRSRHHGSRRLGYHELPIAPLVESAYAYRSAARMTLVQIAAFHAALHELCESDGWAPEAWVTLRLREAPFNLDRRQRERIIELGSIRGYFEREDDPDDEEPVLRVTAGCAGAPVRGRPRRTRRCHMTAIATAPADRIEAAVCTESARSSRDAVAALRHGRQRTRIRALEFTEPELFAEVLQGSEGALDEAIADLSDMLARGAEDEGIIAELKVELEACRHLAAERPPEFGGAPGKHQSGRPCSWGMHPGRGHGGSALDTKTP
jgi:hypothetical protein